MNPEYVDNVDSTELKSLDIDQYRSVSPPYPEPEKINNNSLTNLDNLDSSGIDQYGTIFHPPVVKKLDF
jgi:hypothetical protein